jgi:hypothetical protein
MIGPVYDLRMATHTTRDHLIEVGLQQIRSSGYNATGVKDQRELITIPSLPDAADWQKFDTARLALGPNLSRKYAADRYKIPV